MLRNEVKICLAMLPLVLIDYTLTYMLTYQEDFDMLERETYLFRAALDMADVQGYHELFVQLAAAIAHYVRKCLIYGAERYLMRAIELAQTIKSDTIYPCLLKLLEERICLRLYQDDHSTAISLMQRGLTIAKEIGDVRVQEQFLAWLNKENESACLTPLPG